MVNNNNNNNNKNYNKDDYYDGDRNKTQKQKKKGKQQKWLQLVLGSLNYNGKYNTHFPGMHRWKIPFFESRRCISN